MDRFFTWFASKISFASRPAARLRACAFGTILVWGVTGPLFGFSDTWQLVINTGTTIVTFLMVFLIQNSTNRDAAAMQAKLDELLRAVAKARAEFIGIEHLTEKQVEEIRDALEQRPEAAEGRQEGKAQRKRRRICSKPILTAGGSAARHRARGPPLRAPPSRTRRPRAATAQAKAMLRTPPSRSVDRPKAATAALRDRRRGHRARHAGGLEPRERSRRPARG